MWAGQRADLIIARVQDVRAAGIALVALIALGVLVAVLALRH